MSQAHEETISCDEQSASVPLAVTANWHAGARFDVQACKAAKERFRDANDKARKKKVQESLDKAQQFYEKDDVWAVRIPVEHMTPAEKKSFIGRLRPVGIMLQLSIDGPCEYVGVAAVRTKKDLYNHSPDAHDTLCFLAKCRADLVV